MIRRKAIPFPDNYLRTPSPEPGFSPSIAPSDCDADDEDAMSMEDVRPSRPLSITIEEKSQSQTTYHPHRPTLPDVLSNSAPPPWTLSAFTAYLSQNHCLENLEFTIDAERYKERYDALVRHLAGRPLSADTDETRNVRMLWKRLIDAYITPDCPREINIPSHVRETLLSLPYTNAAPDPDTLDEAVKIIYNLMEESVLISFLNEAPPSSKSIRIRQERSANFEAPRRKRGGSDSSNEKKPTRGKSRRRASPSLDVDSPFSASDPTGRLTPSTTHTKSRRARSNTSSGSGDLDSMTDDSASGHSSRPEPMTPPTTPPSSDFGGSSPKTRPDNTWSKLLGWKKKSSGGIRESRFDD